jgi:succinate dehydrogenase/fumarate reductase cytochrome b subunit
MVIVNSLFGLLTEAENMEQVIRKHPLPISLMDSERKARMKVPKEGQGTGIFLLPILEKLPVLSRYGKTRGWFYVISWLHRFTGIGLLLLLMVYLYALSSMQTSDVTNAKTEVIASSIFLFLAWASSLVVSFHALNGGRLILYELFGRRNDADMIRWIFGLSAAYVAMVGLMMVMKNQHVSAFFFWLTAFFSGAIVAYVAASRLWKKKHSVLWKLQAFLLITVPAYLCSCAGSMRSHEAQGAIRRMQDVFIRLVPLPGDISALSCRVRSLFDCATTASGTTQAG